MQIFLDDERIPPPDWVQVRWPEEAITLLEQGNVTEMSLEYDLGVDARGTGYDVILWFEEAVHEHDFHPLEIRIHSANSSAREKMESSIAKIIKLAKKIR